MRKFLAIVLSATLFSCSAKLVPLNGNYPQTPMVFHSNKSYDQVWDRLVDVFAQKGLAIKIIDRSSGLIVSDNSKMPASIEDPKTGKLVDPNAFVAVPYYKGNGPITPLSGRAGTDIFNNKKPILAEDVFGEWNVRIKKEDAGTSINVNINNLTYNKYNSAVRMNEKKRLDDYKSTGVFEALLADLVK